MKTNYKQPKFDPQTGEINPYMIDLELKTNKQPDPRKHQLVSFIKSGIRISGYICLPFDLTTACLILVFSELVGILEELV
jgi:hypothetical protein